MRSYIILIVVLTSACAAPMEPEGVQLSEERMNEAFDEWTAHGNVAGDCRDADPPRVIYLPQDELRERCLQDISIWACTLIDYNLILVEEAADPHQRELAIEHELRHWMSACTWLGWADPEHYLNSVWYDWHGERIRTTETWGFHGQF